MTRYMSDNEKNIKNILYSPQSLQHETEVRTVWHKEIYSPILCKKISPEGKNVMSNRKRAQSKTHMRQMNNNTYLPQQCCNQT